jgi:hypothetical protein
LHHETVFHTAGTGPIPANITNVEMAEDSGNRLPNGSRGFDSLNPHQWPKQDNVEGVAQTDKRTGKGLNRQTEQV